MKKQKKVWDIDFIGGQGEMTKDEEKAVTEYLKKKKRKTISNSKKVKKAA